MIHDAHPPVGAISTIPGRFDNMLPLLSTVLSMPGAHAAVLRPCPYPYRAMMAICSDLDETPDGETYFEIARFLNTSSEGKMGRGLGLEIGNTIYFDMPENQFAYWNTDDDCRARLRRLIQSGHIDCFHSFGDLATTRSHAERALADLERHACRIECWIDHAAVPTNFGSDIMQGAGDIPGADSYHADLTYAHGVRFVWRGRVTSVIGQNRRRSLRGLVNRQHLRQSLHTVAIEAAKGILARLGSEKYAMHAANGIIRSASLRDGHRIAEFMRCNPYWGGVSRGATASALGDVVTDSFLRTLIARNGICLLYTHLGKSSESNGLFGSTTINALRRLAGLAKRRELLVTTTRRVLGYCAALRFLSVRATVENGHERVLVDTGRLAHENLPVNLDGITFYVERSATAKVFVDGEEMSDIQRNPADERGRESVSVSWRQLIFPAV